MRIVRRLLGSLSSLAGLFGVILGLASLVGVWICYVEIVDRVNRVCARIEDELADTHGNLQKATGRLRETEAKLVSVRTRETESRSGPAVQKRIRRETSRKAIESVRPEIAEARSALLKASEAALIANGLLGALAELPVVERTSFDTDRLREASVRIEEITERSDRLLELLGRDAQTNDEAVAEESSRAIETIRKPIRLAEEATSGIEQARQKVTDSRARLKYWINWVAGTLTILLVWLTVGQVSLMIHGWKWLRR